MKDWNIELPRKRALQLAEGAKMRTLDTYQRTLDMLIDDLRSPDRGWWSRLFFGPKKGCDIIDLRAAVASYIERGETAGLRKHLPGKAELYHHRFYTLEQLHAQYREIDHLLRCLLHTSEGETKVVVGQRMWRLLVPV